MYLIYLFTIVILALHLLNYFRGHVPIFRHTFLDVPLFMFLSTQVVSFYFSIDRLTSFYGYYSRLNGGLLSLLAFAILYWVLVIYLNPRLVTHIINFSLLSGLIVAAYGIAQHFGIDRHLWLQDVQSRVFSTFGQPNWLAAYLCLLLPFTLSHYLNAKSKSLRFAYFLLASIFYLCLLFTKSKTGLIASTITLAVYFALHFRLYSRQLLFIIVPLVVLSFTVKNPLRDYLFPPKITAPASVATLNITPSEDIRRIVWTGALDLWRQFPLFGTGPETFAFSYYWVRPRSHNLTSEWEFLYNKAHNEYLNYLATTGIFGLTTYCLVIFVTLFQLFRSRQYAYLTAYLSILITNSSGFTISLTSLFFFVIPALVAKPYLHSPPKPQPIVGHLLLLLGFLYFTSKLLFFYLADVIYNDALNFNSHGQLTSAYKSLRLCLQYRPLLPQYLTLLSSVTAKLAVTTKSDAYLQESIRASELSKTLSPFDLNYWKERSQIYYYLSSLDSKYYLEAINSLTIATKLAPTDAKTFYLLAKFYQNISKNTPAIENYQQAITLKPNYDHAYYDLGLLYFQQKKYPQAIANFEKVLLYAPTNADAQNYLNQARQLNP